MENKINKEMLINSGVSVSEPVVSSESQLNFRIGLARERTASYPLDSMDFIMMDLERPDHCTRHAYNCTGDLTGRLLEFLSCSEGVDAKSDPRLPELFERILKQRRPSGLFGRYTHGPKREVDGLPESNPLHGGDKLFSGLIRYYELTGDSRALEGAQGIAERLLSAKYAWRDKAKKATAGFFMAMWVTEPFARLYAITKDERYLDFCRMINQHLETCDNSVHAHTFMSTLRGLQEAALITGDKTWNKKPEQNRRLIIDEHYEMPDGCTPELFPFSPANEGCSIADWLMVNLNAGLISGDDSAYEKAERILWNALFFNQWIHGSFGLRSKISDGYQNYYLEEGWCCCVHNGGLAITEYARHAVTFRDNTVCVNLLVPGTYMLALPGREKAEVKIDTQYPASAEAVIEVKNIPAHMAVKVRIPDCIARPHLTETKNSGKIRVTLKGRLGHKIEECHSGVMLMYGPLVLAPSYYYWSPPVPGVLTGRFSSASGTIPEPLLPNTPRLKIDGKTDSDGFLQLGGECWGYFDEGPGARCWVDGSAKNVPVKFHNGVVKELRFTPLCYNTSYLVLCETPIVFKGLET